MGISVQGSTRYLGAPVSKVHQERVSSPHRAQCAESSLGEQLPSRPFSGHPSPLSILRMECTGSEPPGDSPGIWGCSVAAGQTAQTECGCSRGQPPTLQECEASSKGTGLRWPRVTAPLCRVRGGTPGGQENTLRVPGTEAALSQTTPTTGRLERLVTRVMPGTTFVCKFNDEAGDLTKKGFLQTWMFGSSLFFFLFLFKT